MQLNDLSTLSEQFSQQDAHSSMAGQNVILMNQFTRTLLPLVLKKPVLRIIANHQRNLDALDVEGLATLERAYEARNDFQSFSFLKTEPTLEEWDTFVTKYLDTEFQKQLNHDSPDSENLHYYTMAYLLSGTFKDCSLIFKIGRAGGRPSTVTVIDMDTKSVTKMKKWADLDKDIAMAFTSEDDDGRRCVETIPQSPTKATA